MTYIEWPKMLYRAEGDGRVFANTAEAEAAGPEWRTIDEIRANAPQEIAPEPVVEAPPVVEPQPDAEPLTDRVSPPDLDGDGKPGGSVSAPDDGDRDALRAQYRTVLGKNPFPGWDSATLRAKIEAAV